MATFETRIEDIIGATASLGSDDTAANQQAIQDALQDTASDIINKVRPEMLIQFATKSSNITSNPIATNLENSRVLMVDRKNSDTFYISCVYINPDLGGKIQNPESIYFADEKSPNWTFNDNDVYVYPAPTSDYPSRYYTMETPSIEHSASSVAKFPNELEQVLVLGASAILKQRQITFYNEDEDSEIVALHRAQWAELEQKYQDALAPFMPTRQDA